MIAALLEYGKFLLTLSLLIVAIGIAGGSVEVAGGGLLVFAVLLCIGAAILLPVRVKFNKRISSIENTLASQGFIVNRKIGCFHQFEKDVASWFLYVDNVNRQWLVTAPFHPKPDIKIWKFEDLLGFEFFDKESTTLLDKVGKHTSRKHAEDGSTGAYGLKLELNDCSNSKTVLICDFMRTGGKKNLEAKNVREPRTHKIYKRNMEIIEDMKVALKDISTSRQNIN